MDKKADKIIVVSQNIVQGKTTPDEEMTFADALFLLINRFGYSTQQTHDVLSALLTSGKVRIHYKEIWQRLSLQNTDDLMKPEAAEKLVNDTLPKPSSGLMRIPILQAPQESGTICVSIRKPRQWADLLRGEKCNGYYEDDEGRKITIRVEITEPMASEDYHRAQGENRRWFVGNPETVGVGSLNYFYLLPDTSG